MAFIKDYYTDDGKHYVKITSEGEQWIEYQKKMLCTAKLSWCPPCEETEDQNGIVYDISECISIGIYPTMSEKEIHEMIKGVQKMLNACDDYLLEPGSYSNELRYLFWNTGTKSMQGIYIPEKAKMDEKKWIQKFMSQLLGNAITKRWPEQEILTCYRLYKNAFEDGSLIEDASTAQVREIEPDSVTESQMQTARQARYALWEDLEEEPKAEEMNVRGTVQQVKGRVKQFFGKKEK